MKLAIEKAIYGGSGLARHEGKAIFVPFTLPGETVEAELAQNKESYAEARLQQILQPSPARIGPRCPYFGECGGCHYQHANYEEQLRLKAAILEETLTRSQIRELPSIEVLPAQPFEYRNRIRLHVQQQPFALGYMRAQSHRVLPVAECPIASPALMKAVHELVANCSAELSGWVRELELFTNAQQDRVLLSIFVPAALASPKEIKQRLHSLWSRLQAALPHVAGCAAFQVPEGKGFPALAAQIGAGHLIYTTAGRDYRVSAGSFFQVNRFLLDRLVNTVCEGSHGALAWDLYAGVGLFARQLADRFERVVAVEAAPASVADLRSNLGARAHQVVASNTLQFLKKAAPGGAPRPDLVVLDPPRAGVGKEAVSLLAQIGPAQITYVSCDPSTLARDLSTLLQSGYRLQRLHLIDLFPQTFHLETIAQLTRI